MQAENTVKHSSFTTKIYVSSESNGILPHSLLRWAFAIRKPVAEGHEIHRADRGFLTDESSGECHYTGKVPIRGVERGLIFDWNIICNGLYYSMAFDGA